MMHLDPTPRVDLGQAMTSVLQVLKDTPAISIAGLSKATGVDRRTVKKAVDLIIGIQDSLATKKMQREKVGKTWIISVAKRTSELIDRKMKVLR
jgi:predicted regulator of amino acid metabolism with ACT domain